MAPVARREHLGTIDWQNLPVYWQQVAELVARLEALWDRPRDPTALTARAFDEAQTAGTRTYIEAQRCLGVAIDNHEALGINFHLCIFKYFYSFFFGDDL